MKSKGAILLLLLLGGVALYYATKKKYKGSIIVDPLGEGKFIDDPADLLTDDEKTMFEI